MLGFGEEWGVGGGGGVCAVSVGGSGGGGWSDVCREHLGRQDLPTEAVAAAGGQRTRDACTGIRANITVRICHMYIFNVLKHSTWVPERM